MQLIAALLLIAGCILALSGPIVARRPDARELINKLVPFQGAIGVALLVMGILSLLSTLDVLRGTSGYPILSASLLAVVGCSVLLGFLFGMPLIAKWIPGDSPAEQKAAEISAKIAGFQVVLGLIGLIGAAASILFRLGILPPM
ncbi:MAG: hypothetical protein R3B48_00630 [Kofleriaceae bacterium]